ncbi:hypothetical protein LTS18_003152 [Coniosporium uncinatum]|uniref:Uncharacterized protein n=1 Tax=Coniosporium uncinatum TaxID=93489 RepID=A0ACC3DCL0_9PEZI|nr:hypothetical protein LTS18_003152 [Coniosporium uncinatum]
MATSTPDYFSRKVSLGRVRPGANTVQTPSRASPSTPNFSRSLSGLYGSPGSSFRADAEYLVFEFEEQRRVGDYRQWLPGYERPGKRRDEPWGEEYELWRHDIFNWGRELDLGLVEDKIERVLREIDQRQLLLDARSKRITLTIASLIPRQLLFIVLACLFHQFQAPTITLIPTSIAATIAAGLRSALIIDIGWAETIVTAVVEYKEIVQKKSVRAGKLLSEEAGRLLDSEGDGVTLEEAEELLTRLCWCRTREARTSKTSTNEESTQEGKDFDAPDHPVTASLPSRGHPTIPFSRFADPADHVLFATNVPFSSIDDHDLPLHRLAFAALLQLPTDVRKTCMSRILITGGVSSLPGLKTRLISEIGQLVEKRGWDPVHNYGSAQKQREKILHQRKANAQAGLKEQEAWDAKAAEWRATEGVLGADRKKPPAFRHGDGIEDSTHTRFERSQRGDTKDHPPPPVEGVVRGIETLGAWAGASLCANLRIRGVVEVERDKFSSQGLDGAKRETGRDVSVLQEKHQRQSMMPGMGPEKGKSDRRSWTLGIWA